MAQPTDGERDFSKCKVICFNGPPGSGKDTAALAVYGQVFYHAPWMQPRQLKFAEPLKKATHELYGVPYPWNYYDQKEHYEEKDVPCDAFMGRSPRDAYINLSENAAKPLHGNQFFGWVMRRKMRLAQGVMCYLFSDSGFADELFPVIDLVGAQNVLIVELEAKGKNYDNDSRGYIGAAVKARYPKVHVRRIFNEIGGKDELELFKVYCWGSCRAFLGIEEID